MSPDVRVTADRRSYAARTAAFTPVAKEGRMSGRWNQSGVNIPCAGASTDHPVSRTSYPWTLEPSRSPTLPVYPARIGEKREF